MTSEKNALTTVSDAELEAEIARRKAEAEFERRKANDERLVLLRKVLTREVVDGLVPEHGRTSCSDTSIRNGFYSNGDDSAPRCERCALLEFLEGQGDGHTIRIWFDFQPLKENT